VTYEISILGKLLRLTPNTQFLALYLAKNYINELLKKDDQKVNEKKMRAIAHSCVFFSSKMRETLQFCPLMPKMLGAGGKN